MEPMLTDVTRWSDSKSAPHVPSAAAAPVTVPESDEVVLARLQRRDPDALALLYGRYGRIALGVAGRVLRDDGAAADAVQDAFLAVWRQAGSYDADRGNVRTWLLSIVRHRCIDQLRRARARGGAEPLDEATEDQGAPSVFEAACHGLARRAILAALAELPRDQRQAIELAYFGGYTHVEIAAIQRVPLGTVKGRLRIGLQKLRALLASGEAAG